jgi:hypothetical protein
LINRSVWLQRKLEQTVIRHSMLFTHL